MNVRDIQCVGAQADKSIVAIAEGTDPAQSRRRAGPPIAKRAAQRRQQDHGRLNQKRCLHDRAQAGNRSGRDRARVVVSARWDAGEVLLDRRLLKIPGHRLDVSRDMQRLDIGELAEPMLVAPGEEAGRSPVIGKPRVVVADGRGEEFEEAAGGVVAGVGDERRDEHLGLDQSDRFRGWDGGQLGHGG